VVRPCFQCRRNICEESGFYVDACNNCGELTCTECISDHPTKCRRVIKITRRSNGSCAGSASATPPWLQRIRDGLVCAQCNSTRDLGSHSCQICRGSICLNQNCVSELRTCDCGCGRDICGKCSTEIEDARGRKSRVCVKSNGLGNDRLWGTRPMLRRDARSGDDM
jgi:hypothetical protein